MALSGLENELRERNDIHLCVGAGIGVGTALMSDDDECRWNCPFCGKVFATFEDFDGHTIPRNQPIFGIPLCRLPEPDTLQT